jgi:hypothetical protein
MEQSYGLIEVALVFAILLALLGYELHSVRKSIKRDEDRTSVDASRRSGEAAPQD